MSEPGDEVVASLVDQLSTLVRPEGTVIVSLAGPVCSGKTTFAGRVCTSLVRRGISADTVSTDGFLRTTADLRAAGLFERKGFPESYRRDVLRSAIASVSRRVPTVVPVYSHATFDPDDRRCIEPVDVVIVEGVNALQPDVSVDADLRWYLDVANDVVLGWYIERFRRLTANARTDGGFYEQFLVMSPEELDEFACQVWRSINQPNLEECILPTRAHADTVIDAKRLRLPSSSSPSSTAGVVR
jgi:type I pantothenate kinase